MKILVTGASGSFGNHLVTTMAGCEKINIRVLEHRSPVNLTDCERVPGNLDDLDSLVVATSGVDVVLHLAALTHSHNPDDYFRVNFEGTKNLVTACIRSGVSRIVYMSSGAAHADGGGYSKSKLEAEQWICESSLQWTILRPREVYGMGGKEGINKLISWIRKLPAIPVIGNGNYRLSPVYIDDVVLSTVEAVFNPEASGDIYTLAGPEEMSYVELVERLSTYFGVRPMKLFLPVVIVQGMAKLLRIININAMVPDQIPRLLCEKSHSGDPVIPQLNYMPRTLEEGLKECFPHL